MFVFVFSTVNMFIFKFLPLVGFELRIYHSATTIAHKSAFLVLASP